MNVLIAVTAPFFSDHRWPGAVGWKNLCIIWGGPPAEFDPKIDPPADELLEIDAAVRLSFERFQLQHLNVLDTPENRAALEEELRATIKAKSPKEKPEASRRMA